jgi:hypothetical protein
MSGRDDVVEALRVATHLSAQSEIGAFGTIAENASSTLELRRVGVAPAILEVMLPHPRHDGSDEYEAMTTIAKSPSIAPPPRKSSRQVQASLEVSSSPTSVRPVMFSENEPDDVTRLMPSPHASAFPTPPRVPNDIVPTMRPLKNRVHLPRGQNTEPPAPMDRPSMRPTAPPAPPSRPPPSMRPQTPPSMRPPASMRPLAGLNSLGAQDATRTAFRPMSVPPPPPSSHAPMSGPEDTFRPVAVANAMGTLQIHGQRGSDSRFDAPPIAHNTMATVVLKGRPTASWAMALVAMGVFGGILTAVVTGGGGASIVQAGAAFVDPSRAASAQEMPKVAAAAAPIRVEEKIAAAPVAAPYYPPAVIEPARFETKVEPKPEPVAVKPAAPTTVVRAWQPPARTAAPTPTPVPQPVVVAAPTPKPAPVAAEPKPEKPAKVAAAPKPAKGQAAADLESANQADELARQQLEQSLK